MACAATRIDTAICPGNGRKADHALRLKPDHLIGAGQGLERKTTKLCPAGRAKAATTVYFSPDKS